MKPIGILGAAGTVGLLTARLLAGRGVPLILAARQTERLEDAAAQLSRQVPVRLAAVDARDQAAVSRLCAEVSVLLQCAGPYTDAGDPPMRAAIATATPLLDVTGEQAWVRQSITRYDAPARAAGVPLAHAMGVEVLLADAAAHLLVARHPEVTSLELAHVVSGFASSPGSRLTALRVIQAEAMAWVDGTWRPCLAGSRLRLLQFNPPFSRCLGVSMPGVEMATIPLHLPQLRTIHSSIALPSGLALGLYLSAPLAARAPLGTAGRLAEKALAWTDQTPLATDATAQFQIALTGHGPAGPRHLTVCARAPYGLSAEILARSAVRVARLGPHVGRGGVLAPAQMVDPAGMLTELAQDGWIELDGGPGSRHSESPPTTRDG